MLTIRLRTFLLYLISLNLISINILEAQQSISGFILDKETGSVVPYVSIFFQNNQTSGVISNEEGAYRIEIPNEQDEDQLVFSVLGYQTQYLPINEIQDSVLNIQLEKSFIELDEVVVISDLGLRAIVKKALEKIPENYGSDKHFLETYYRRYTVTNDKHSHIKEAFFTLEDGAYDDKLMDINIWLQHYRESDDFRKVKWLDDRPGSNFLFVVYRWFNSVRNQTLHYMSTRSTFSGKLENYTFSDRGTYLENGDSLIRIAYNFNPTPEVQKKSHPESYYLYEGEILINLTDYAIIRNTLGQGREDYFHDIIYNKKGDKYYPQRFHYIIELGHGPNDINSHKINAFCYFYNVLASREERKGVKKGKRLSKEVPINSKTIKYDPAFWESNKKMIQLDLPQALQNDLNRIIKLEEQYRKNAKKVIDKQ
ncbi:MAG: carboxypeptidase-like regulatory domain-containing protein [Bacteroidota bacterium]